MPIPARISVINNHMQIVNEHRSKKIVINTMLNKYFSNVCNWFSITNLAFILERTKRETKTG